MSQRRMFSPDIVCSEEFLDMPPTSRELYFQLGMRADDDGFIQPKGVMRNINATGDDLKILVAKRFLLPFESGVVVVKHWLIHNMIRQDRYKPSRFIEEKKALFIKENKAYTEKEENGVPLLATTWQPNGNHSAPQVRLGKVNTSESTLSQRKDLRIEAEPSRVEREPKGKPKYPNARTVFPWFPRPQPSWSINTTELKHAELLFVRGESQVKKALEFVRENFDDEFCPKVTKPSDLERKWQDILAYKKKKGL